MPPHVNLEQLLYTALEANLFYGHVFGLVFVSAIAAIISPAILGIYFGYLGLWLATDLLCKVRNHSSVG